MCFWFLPPRVVAVGPGAVCVCGGRAARGGGGVEGDLCEGDLRGWVRMTAGVAASVEGAGARGVCTHEG